jgi:hypothetical protein
MTRPRTPGLPPADPLLRAFRQQRALIKKLLDEAGVPVAEAEGVLAEAFRDLPVQLETHRAEIELLHCVDAACARYAVLRGHTYRGLAALKRK